MSSENSLVEKAICSKEFSYLHPYFYKNPFSLRCILGMGDTEEEYYSNAKKRALEIYKILFSEGADAIFFNYWVLDECNNEATYLQTDLVNDDCNREVSIDDRIDNLVEIHSQSLRFLLKYQYLYRHFSVKELPVYEEYAEENEDFVRRNRVICFSDGKGFDYENLIENEFRGNGHDVSFVSFEHECIFSVYDERGCDIVFMTYDKMKEFYRKLEPYFHPYDVEEMRKRYLSNQ